jgi:hypothetical protein
VAFSYASLLIPSLLSSLGVAFNLPYKTSHSSLVLCFKDYGSGFCRCSFALHGLSGNHKMPPQLIRALGFQELPQLEADYGKVGMQKIITTVGNVVSGSARAKETLEWLSSDIFGKVVQIKKGVTIDRDKTSINLNENMDSLVPASKISDMPTGWICGQTARDFIQTKTGIGGSMNVQEAEEFKTSKFFCKTDFDMKEIKKEEAAYVPLPKFYTFKSREERERILYRNFVNVGMEVKEMIKDVQNKRGAK